jgi:hypothetical protein
MSHVTVVRPRFRSVLTSKIVCYDMMFLFDFYEESAVTVLQSYIEWPAL